jgi:AcrR family transcriptional regulator
MNIHHSDPGFEGTTPKTSAVTGSRRRPGGRNARIQAAVFEATFRLLEEKGYEALSMASIAARAGVHEATLYRRWKTKEQLVIDAANHQVIGDIPIPHTGTFRSDLIEILQSLRTFLLSAIGRALFQTIVATANVPEFNAFRKEHWHQRRMHFQVIFDRAIARGECSPQIDSQLFLEMLAGALYVRLFVANEPVDEMLPERIVDLALSGKGLGLSTQ